MTISTEMGKLIDGSWVVRSIITTDSSGAYDRLPRTFLDNEHIQTIIRFLNPRQDFNRYHLYISYACPWATRTLIYRKLKKLEEHISVSVVHPNMLDEGWIFDESFLKQQRIDRLNMITIFKRALPKGGSKYNNKRYCANTLG